MSCSTNESCGEQSLSAGKSDTDEDSEARRSVPSQATSQTSNAEGFDDASTTSSDAEESHEEQWTSAGRSTVEDENEFERSFSSQATSQASSAEGLVGDDESAMSSDTEESREELWASAGRTTVEDEDGMEQSFSSQATSKGSNSEGFIGDDASGMSSDSEWSH